MHLTNLKVSNFKSYEGLDVDFCQNVNCLVGNNGVGKTNLLDAMYYLSFCKSSRGSGDVPNIRRGEDFFAIHGRYVRDAVNEKGREEDTVSCVCRKGQPKQMKWNGKVCKTLGEHIGRLPLVMVSPQDQGIIMEGSEVRRRFVDGVLAQTDNVYLDHLLQYSRALEQRNRLLKLFWEAGNWDDGQMGIWDEQLVRHGEALRSGREHFFDDFVPLFDDYYAWITNGGEQGMITYVADRDKPLAEQLSAARARDRQALFTTVGPHKDDVELTVGDMAVRRYGSQGQQKTFVLAMKLAQFEYIYRHGGVKPILLLDDVFDKLDMVRVTQLVELVGSERFGQVFVTDTQVGRVEGVFAAIPQVEHRIFKVEDGGLKNV
jgi:DNA replication and repair protein RecF